MALEKEDIDRLREIFVTRQECDTITNGLEERLQTDGVKLAVIETKLNQIMWLVGAVGGGVIASLVKLFMGG